MFDCRGVPGMKKWVEWVLKGRENEGKDDEYVARWAKGKGRIGRMLWLGGR